MTHSMASKRGDGDFSTGEEYGAGRRFSVVQMYVDVFEQNRAFVDKDAHRQGQPSQGHNVDRLPGELEQNHCCKERKGDRDNDDQTRNASRAGREAESVQSGARQ